MIAQAATVIGWVAAPYLMEKLLFLRNQQPRNILF